MCPLLNRDCYIYIRSVRSKIVHAKQVPICTSYAKPERAEYNYTSRVYPTYGWKWDILNASGPRVQRI